MTVKNEKEKSIHGENEKLLEPFVFTSKKGRSIMIKIVEIEDYIKNDNYAYSYRWKVRIDRYLLHYGDLSNLEKDRQKYYDRFLEPEKYTLIGAFYQDHLIGTCGLHIRSEVERIRHVGSWAIGIAPEYQNEGIGTELLKVIEEVARKKGLLKLEAIFNAENKRACHLYIDIMGYEIEGRRKLALCQGDGTFEDEIYLGKVIQ